MNLSDVDIYLVDQDACVRTASFLALIAAISRLTSFGLKYSPNTVSNKESLVRSSLTHFDEAFAPTRIKTNPKFFAVGSPATVVYYERAPMNIMRPKATVAVGYFSGQIKKDNFKTLVLQAQSAAGKEVKADAARVFRVPF